MPGAAENAPPSILYSILNPVTGVTLGSENADAHALAGAVSVGAVGNITTFTILLTPHGPVPAVPAAILPHAADNTYLACTVWQPGVVVLGAAENALPSMLYCTLNPETAGTVGKVNAEAQVLAGAVITGAVGNIRSEERRVGKEC